MSKPRSLARSHRIGRARKPRLSAWQQLNQAREIGFGALGDKRVVLGIVTLVIVLGGIILSQGPAFHNYQYQCIPTEVEIQQHLPCGDPVQVLWMDNGFANSGGEFNMLNTQFASNCDGVGSNCLKLTSNNTQPALALSKQPVDVSTVVSHEFFMGLEYCFSANPTNVNDRWGIYLTRNSTIPSGLGANGYSPKTDVNVALALETQDTGSGNMNEYTWLQKDSTKTLQSGDVSGGTQGLGTLYLSGGSNQPAVACSNTQNEQVSLTLNYTGASPSTSGVLSKLFISTPTTTASITQTMQPWFNLQDQYYIGFYMLSCSGCVSVQFVGLAAPNGLNNIERMDPAPSIVVAKPPNVDTGGFFGPIMRFFISAGVFIVQNILSFAVYLYNILSPIGTAIFNLAASGLSAIIAIFYNVVKAILNSIGSVLGLGNLGDKLFDLLTQIASAFTTLWGLVINTYSNLLGAGVSFLSALGSTLTNYWTLLTTWLIGLADYLSLFWSTVALFGQISISMLLSFWLLYGALRFSRSMAGGMEWYNTTGYFMMLGFSITLFFISLIINYVIIPIAHIVTSSSTTLGARPKIEVAGTSTP